MAIDIEAKLRAFQKYSFHTVTVQWDSGISSSENEEQIKIRGQDTRSPLNSEINDYSWHAKKILLPKLVKQMSVIRVSTWGVDPS